jgi:hypothetical protein
LHGIKRRCDFAIIPDSKLAVFNCSLGGKERRVLREGEGERGRGGGRARRGVPGIKH